MMDSWGLLDPEVEQSLHKARLLAVEERPFKRVSKRLTTISNLASNALYPHEAAGNQSEAQQLPQNPGFEHVKEDITYDFAAFDSSILRLQFLHDANERERERYAADQERIVAECQEVRTNTARLRDHLDDARATLAQRKKFDELADKITSNQKLRPRDDQIASLAKLEEECRELERESLTYSLTWGERRDQFNRIMDEGMLLRRQIRDEKEEVDRREGMDEGNESEAGQTPAQNQTPGRSHTPKPEGEGATPRIEVDDATKLTTTSGTPLPPVNTTSGTPAAGTPGPDSLRPTSHAGSRSASRDASPMPPGNDDGKDIDMGVGESQDTPRSAPTVTDDKMEVDG